MRTMRFLVLVLCFIAAPAAAGVDQMLPGTKLLLKQTRLDVVGNASTVGLGDGAGSADDPTAAGGTLRMVAEGGAGFDVTYTLDAAGWSPLSRKKPEKGWKFTKGTPVKRVTIKAGKQVRVIGKGTTLEHTIDEDPTPVHVVLAIGAQRYCWTFAGTPAFKAGKKYVVKGATAPATCFAGATTTSTSVATSTTIDGTSTTVIGTTTTTSTAPADAPDLVPTAFSASSGTVVAGDSVMVSFSVQNQGTMAASGTWFDQVWLSTDGVIDDPGDVFMGNVFGPGAVAANATYNVASVPLAVPGAQAAGDYFLLLRLDADGAIAETDEDNNTWPTPVAITVEAP